MGRGERFGATPTPRSRAQVGVLYHSVGDREDALKELDLGFTQAYAEIGQAIGMIPMPGESGFKEANARAAAHPAQVAWWNAAVVPLAHAWRTFKSEQSGTGMTGPAPGYVAYGERWQTDWSIYEGWQDKLNSLRGGARAMGIKLSTPEPTKLPTTITQDVKDIAASVASKATGAVGDVWTLGKVAVYGGLGLLGVVAVSSLVSNLKSGKDPAENYMALARRFR